MADGTSRLSVVVDSTFTAEAGFETVPPGYEGLDVSAVVVDGDGRISRIPGTPAALGVEGARSVITLAPPGSTGALAPPVHVLAIELELSLTGLPDTLANGIVTVRALGTSPDPTGDGWTDTALADIAPQSWTIDDGGGGAPYEPAQPGELVVPTAGPFASTAWRLSFGRVSAPEIAALANPVFLERTGSPRGRHARGEHLRPARHDPPARRGRRLSVPAVRRSRCSSSTARRWISPATPAA